MALLGAVSCCKKTQPGEPAFYSAADFDSTIDGKAVSLYTLKNANGMAAQITNYGGIIVDVWVPAKDGAFKDVVLGYPKLAEYFVSTTARIRCTGGSSVSVKKCGTPAPLPTMPANRRSN